MVDPGNLKGKCSPLDRKNHMIYMVDCTFQNSDREAEWNDWYQGHLERLLSVPGISSAQRFMVDSAAGNRYHAMYSVDSPKVFESAAYERIRGGNFPPEWRAAITNWRRAVFDGVATAPNIQVDSRLLIASESDKEQMMQFPLAYWLYPIALDIAGGQRGIAVSGKEEAVILKKSLSKSAESYTPICEFLSTKNS